MRQPLAQKHTFNNVALCLLSDIAKVVVPKGCGSSTLLPYFPEQNWTKGTRYMGVTNYYTLLWVFTILVSYTRLESKQLGQS